MNVIQKIISHLKPKTTTRTFTDEEAREITRQVDPELAAALDAQDAQIEAIQAAEAQYKQDNDLNALLAFWDDIWANGGTKFEGSHWCFRAVDLNLKAGNNDKAWSLLGIIYVKRPNYREKVHKYRYKILKQEKRYMGSLEHLVEWYAMTGAYDKDKFLEEARRTVKKVDVKASEDTEKIVEKLADIAERGGDIHEALKKYYVSIGWLDEKWLNS